MSLYETYGYYYRKKIAHHDEGFICMITNKNVFDFVLVTF